MAVKDWLGITEKTLEAVDRLNDSQTESLKRSLDASFAKVSRDMVKLYGSLDGADPDYIKVQLSKLNQLKIARQLLSPKQKKQFEKEMKDLLELQTANGVKYADLMTQALSNPPDLVRQFGTINIESAAIAQDASKRLQNHSEDASKKIIDAVATNLLNGGSVANLRRNIQGALGTTKARAENIARTETLSALNGAATKRYKEYGAEYVQIIALVDQRTTPWCRYRHMKIIKIDESMPPYHFQCLTGDTNVSPIGSISGITVRPFRGEVVSITTSRGYNLTVTPNHPILTNIGFVSAQQINKGDQLVTNFRGDRFATSQADKNDVIPTIKERFETLLCSDQMIAMPMPHSPMYFHGDVSSNDVGVILLDRHLLESQLPLFVQQFVYFYLIGANFSGLFFEVSDSNFSEYIERLFTTSTCGISRFSKSFSLFGRRIIHSGLLLLRAISNGDTLLNKDSMDDVPRTIEPLSNSLVSLTTGIKKDNFIKVMLSQLLSDCGDSNIVSLPVLRNHFRDGVATHSELDTDFFLCQPFIDETDDVIDIQVRNFSGHVYNLSTETGLYRSNSIVTHNCRTVTAPVDPEWINKDDLKWMQEEMKRAKDTGLNVTGKAPFDTKKPSFVMPSTFSKKATGTVTPPPKVTPPKPNFVPSKAYPTNTNLTKDEAIRIGQEFIDFYLAKYPGDYTPVDKSVSPTGKMRSDEIAFQDLKSDLRKRGQEIFNKKYKLEDFITFDKTNLDSKYIEIPDAQKPDAQKALIEFFELTGGFFNTPKIKIVINQLKPRADAGIKNLYSIPYVNIGASGKPESILHEMAHHFEVDFQSRINNSAKFVIDKATGPKQKLSVLTGNKNYKDSETAYPDHYINPYVGKIYQDKSSYIATEVLSMGVERLHSERSTHLDYKTDPSHLSYTIGMLLVNQENQK